MCCLAAMLFMSPVFADVFKWEDAHGRTHYGDTPPVTLAATGQLVGGEGVCAGAKSTAGQGEMNAAEDPVKSSSLKVHNVRMVPEGSAVKCEPARAAIDKAKLAHITQ